MWRVLKDMVIGVDVVEYHQGWPRGCRRYVDVENGR